MQSSFPPSLLHVYSEEGMSPSRFPLRFPLQVWEWERRVCAIHLFVHSFIYSTPLSNLITWLVLCPVAGCTKRKRNTECCGYVIVCLQSISWHAEPKLVPDDSLLNILLDHNALHVSTIQGTLFVWVPIAQKPVRALRGFQWLFWTSKAEDQKASWSNPDGNKSPGCQSVSSVWQTSALKLGSQGLPSGGMCVYFSAAGLCKCFVFRLFCDFKEIWEGRVRRVSFQTAVWG